MNKVPFSSPYIGLLVGLFLRLSSWWTRFLGWRLRRAILASLPSKQGCFDSIRSWWCHYELGVAVWCIESSSSGWFPVDHTSQMNIMWIQLWLSFTATWRNSCEISLWIHFLPSHCLLYCPLRMVGSVLRCWSLKGNAPWLNVPSFIKQFLEIDWWEIQVVECDDWVKGVLEERVGWECIKFLLHQSF